MPTTKNSFVIKKYEGFGGNFVDSQYLGKAYETGTPYMFQTLMGKIFSSQTIFTGKPLIGMTGAKSYGTKEIDTEVFRWRLQGAEHRSAIVLENVEAGNAMPGANNTTFRIKLDLDYFAAPDVLLGEDNDYPLQIVDGPVQDGIGYVYTVKIQGDNPSVFFPPYLLEPGKEFDKVWTTVASEYNREFGTQQYPSIFELESQVGAFAQKVTITNKAMRDSGRLAFSFIYTDPKTGKEQLNSKFLPMAEAKMYDELYQSMEAQYWLGKKQTQPGPDGYWKKTGPGVREQLKDSWNEYYSGPLTVERMKNYLLSIYFSRVNESDRKTVIMTGTAGSLAFHDALASEASSFFTLDTNFIEEYKKNPKHLSYGAQFTHYRGPQGIEVTLVQNPLYDSLKYCKRRHPLYPEMPIDSARMTIMDFASKNGENSNIMQLRVKDTFAYGHTIGTVGPMGPVKGGAVGSLIAGYDIFVEGTGGVVIFDPTTCGELIYDADDN